MDQNQGVDLPASDQAGGHDCFSGARRGTKDPENLALQCRNRFRLSITEFAAERCLQRLSRESLIFPIQGDVQVACQLLQGHFAATRDREPLLVLFKTADHAGSSGNAQSHGFLAMALRVGEDRESLETCLDRRGQLGFLDEQRLPVDDLQPIGFFGNRRWRRGTARVSLRQNSPSKSAAKKIVSVL